MVRPGNVPEISRHNQHDELYDRADQCEQDFEPTENQRENEAPDLATKRREGAEIRHVLGAMMEAKKGAEDGKPSLLDVVALLTDIPAQRLAGGQVGTVVEEVDSETLLVEFSDDQDRAYAVTPCLWADLLVLHHVPKAA